MARCGVDLAHDHPSTKRNDIPPLLQVHVRLGEVHCKVREAAHIKQFVAGPEEITCVSTLKCGKNQRVPEHPTRGGSSLAG